MISGATYDAQVLQGKSLEEIAASLKDPSTDVSKSVVGTANQMTAAICEMTDGKPGTVCDAPGDHYAPYQAERCKVTTLP